jgi:hypothetical protein
MEDVPMQNTGAPPLHDTPNGGSGSMVMLTSVSNASRYRRTHGVLSPITKRTLEHALIYAGDITDIMEDVPMQNTGAPPAS